MAGRGPLPKQSSRRTGHRSKASKTVVPIPGGKHDPIADPPPAPRAWTKEVRAEWRELWRSDIAKLVKHEHLPALRRLFDMRDARRRYERMVLEAPYLTGSMGQQIVNPLMAKIDTLDGKIRDLEDRFFLTPAARLKAPVAEGGGAGLEEIWRRFMNTDDDDDEDDGDADPRLAAVHESDQDR